MGKDREPLNIGEIDQKIRYQDRSQTWDYAITVAAVLETYLVGNLNLEPGITKAIVWMVPALVTAGGFVMGFTYRIEQLRYLQGLKDGILQEVQRTATLAEKPAPQ